MLREYRIELSHVDRELQRTRKLLVEHDPAEPQEHLALRVLAWCLLYEDEMTFGSGPAFQEQPDLESRDLDGRLLTWVDCGAANLEPMLKALQHSRRATAHVVLSLPAARDEVLAEIEDMRQRPPALDRATLWTMDERLVEQVALWQEHRQRWAVTVVGDHIYVDAGRGSADGEVVREALDAPGG